MARPRLPPSGLPVGTQRPARPQSDLIIRSSLPDWVVRTLISNRVRRLSQLAGLSDREMLALDGVGLRAMALIHAELSRREAPDAVCPLPSVDQPPVLGRDEEDERSGP